MLLPLAFLTGTELLCSAVAFGLVFGFLLHRGGVTDFDVIVRLFQFRDFTVLKVMMTAIAVGGVGIAVLHGQDLAQYHIKATNLLAVGLGAAIFGVGMVLYGYCPGTGLAAIATSRRMGSLVEAYDVRPPLPGLRTSKFSGGNQQKIVLAREMERDPLVLLVGQPTRGVDIGAIEFIHKRIIAMRDAGCAVLVVSVELDEILSLADRILVMFHGKIIADIHSSAAQRNAIGLLMAGVTTPQEAQA